MCHEILGVAFCAPTAPPSLSFTCGRLHIVAARRLLCDESRGSCLCFFGSCGRIVKSAGTDGIDLGGLPKVRCASCTRREDEVGYRRHGRDLVDSPLMARTAISRDDVPHYMDAIKMFWDGSEKCPFHHNGRPLKFGVKGNGNQVHDGQEGKFIPAEDNNDDKSDGNSEYMANPIGEMDEIEETSIPKNNPGPIPTDTGDNNGHKINETIIQKAPHLRLSRTMKDQCLDKNGSSNENNHPNGTEDRSIIRPDIGISTSVWAPRNGSGHTTPTFPKLSSDEPKMQKTPSPTLSPLPTSKTISKVVSMRDFLRGE